MYNPATLFDEVDATDAVYVSETIEVGTYDHFLIGVVVTEIAGTSPTLGMTVQYSFDGELWSPQDGMQISDAISGQVDDQGNSMVVQQSIITAPLARFVVTLTDGTTASFKAWGYLS